LVGYLLRLLSVAAEYVNIKIIGMVYFAIIKMTERQQFIKDAHKECHLESFFKEFYMTLLQVGKIMQY
jgi:hypothetical protein